MNNEFDLQRKRQRTKGVLNRLEKVHYMGINI